MTALALGARGCLLGRAVLWSLAVEKERGVANVMKILEDELRRAAALCGVSSLSEARPSILSKEERGIVNSISPR